MSTKIITSKNFNSNLQQFLPSNIDEQFHFGMKILLCSYENKVKENEQIISDLNEKIYNLEDSVNTLKLDNSKFSDDINKLVNENKYLLNLNNNLSNTIKNLESFKNSIIGSIEKESFLKKEETLNDSFVNKMKPNIQKTLNLTTSNTPLPNELSYIKTQLSNYNQDTIENMINSKFERLKTYETNYSSNSRIYEKGISDRDSIENKIKQFRGKLRKNINTDKPFINNSVETKYIPYNNKNNLEDNYSKNTSNRSDQYILSSKFFSECRTVLQKDDNLKLLEILKKSNNNEISKEEAFESVKLILENYPKLINDFQMIFQ